MNSSSLQLSRGACDFPWTPVVVCGSPLQPLASNSWKMSIFSVMEDLTKKVMDVATNRSPTEQKLDEALSNKNWGASATQQREIAAVRVRV
jgi:hypothetical protein